MYISVEQISKRYDGRAGPIDALAPLSFEVDENEFVSIVGPSGCGKSTLLMIISGLLPSSAGMVRIKSALVDAPYTKMAKTRAKELLQLVGLEGFENQYPYELSGGMRQRVAICRALLHDPDLLLMDEPFGALDAIARDQLNEDLLRYRDRARKTIVFVTHSIQEAVFLSDRILVMSPRPGRIEATMDIDLPRPRRLAIRETAEFGAYVGRIIRTFESVGVFRKG